MILYGFVIMNHGDAMLQLQPTSALGILRFEPYMFAQVAHPLQNEPQMMQNSATSSTARKPRVRFSVGFGSFLMQKLGVWMQEPRENPQFFIDMSTW